MKKIFTVLMGILLVASFAYAGDITLSPGFETEILIDKEVSLDNTGIDGNLSAEYYLATCEIGLGGKVRITPKIGVVHNAFETDQFAADIEADNDTGIAVGIAGEVDVYTVRGIDYIDGLTLTGIGEYRYSQTEIDTISIGVIEIDNPIRNDVSIHQWEVGAKLSQQFDFLNVKPYIGLVYSDLAGNVDVNLSVINLDEDIKTEDNFGLRTGISIEPIDNLSIAIDGKFIDETSISASAKYRF